MLDKIKLPREMPKNIEYRISNKEPQIVEVDLSTFDIQYSIFCGLKKQHKYLMVTLPSASSV